MKTIIVPLNGDDSERALPAARELATTLQARIVLLHVNEIMVGARGARFPVRLDEEERITRLLKVARDLRDQGVDAELEVQASSLGNPAGIIADAARRHDADAIVLATRGRPPAIAVLTGSVTQSLLREAPCPVLVVTRESELEPGRGADRRVSAAA